MFSIARIIVRNKVLALAVVAGGVFYFMPADEEPEGPSNPWSVQSQGTMTAQADEDDLVGELMTEATDFLDENGINPIAAADESVGQLDNTAAAFSNANN